MNSLASAIYFISECFPNLLETLSQNETNLHPPLPFLSLMPIKIKNGFSWEWWLLVVDLERSDCSNNDEKKVEEKEKISTVTLQQHKGKVKIHLICANKN